MTTQNNGSMTALEAGLEAVLFAAGDAVTIERLSAALEAAPAELLDAAAALERTSCSWHPGRCTGRMCAA